MAVADVKDPPAVEVPSPPQGPVKRIDRQVLRQLGQQLSKTFERYSSDRNQVELKWLQNLRQYLGIYDPEIDRELVASGRSRAYPKLTRVKCISVLSRIMNLMFPGNEKNWALTASPNADLNPDDVQQAIDRLMQAAQQAGGEPPKLDDDMVMKAVNELAEDRARHLEVWIDDQLQELGGDQTQDYVSLNRSVLKSGIQYGLGLLRGPFVRSSKSTRWGLGENGKPQVTTSESFKPQYEFLPIWDFYPDMSAKTFSQMDGYFIRVVMSKSQVRALMDRPDFYAPVIDSFLKANTSGNYKAKNFETMLRSMGVREQVSDQGRSDIGGKYEIIVWNGPISGEYLRGAGADVSDENLNRDMEAEVWLADGMPIKCDINQWRKLGMDVRTIHAFVFDDDDTSPVGNGLPSIMRDSQMSLCAATRMLLDNASVVCGPNLEINTDLMREDQDITKIEAYKLWYREGDGQSAQFPAVRNIEIDSHLPDLLKGIDLFQKFADTETFVGPQTGGDMDRQKSSEPMRSAAGASMLRSDAALPFKDIVRSFDQFTQSVIYSVVQFNRKFNPNAAPEGDYNVIARGATSLVAKEIRGIQLDQLATTLTDEEKMEVDMRKLARARFLVRDLDDMLVSETVAENNRRSRDAAAQAAQQQQNEMIAANIRKTLSDAFKNISQGQKNSATADAQTVDSALKLLEKGLEDVTRPDEQGTSTGTSGKAAGQAG